VTLKIDQNKLNTQAVILVGRNISATYQAPSKSVKRPQKVGLYIKAELDPYRKCALKGTKLDQNNNGSISGMNTIPSFIDVGSIVTALLFWDGQTDSCLPHLSFNRMM
jgi:hypothetical protein